MQAESAVNAVATPTGAPTCPPCVASSAGLAQVSGAHEPGVLGSQPESPGPHASTLPPPVTRQPSSCTHSGGCGVLFSHCPVLGLHSWQTGLAQIGGPTWVCTHTPPSQPAVVQALLSVAVHGVLSVTLMCGVTQTPAWRPGVLQAPGMALTGLPELSAEQAVLSVTLMWARTHWPASQPGVLQLPGIAVTGLPALSTEQAVLSVTLMCGLTQTPASQPGVLQAPGMALTGLPALSAEQAVLSVTLVCGRTPLRASQPGVVEVPGMALTGLPELSAEQAVLSVTGMCARTHWPASQPGVLQLPGMAVTGLPALSAAHGVLSVTLVVVQRPIRPASAPVPCRVGSQMEVRHGVLAGQGETGWGTDVVTSGTPGLGGAPVKD